MWRFLLGTMGVKSLVQGLNTAATAGFEPRTVWSEVRRRNRLATAELQKESLTFDFCQFFFSFFCTRMTFRKWKCTVNTDLPSCAMGLMLCGWIYKIKKWLFVVAPTRKAETSGRQRVLVSPPEYTPQLHRRSQPGAMKLVLWRHRCMYYSGAYY